MRTDTEIALATHNARDRTVNRANFGVLVLLAVGPGCRDRRPPVATVLSKEECGVIRSVAVAETDGLPVLRETHHEVGFPVSRFAAELGVSDAAADFHARNSESVAISTGCLGTSPSTSGQHSIFVSRPGFSRDMKRAIVEIGIDCGSGCGGNDLVAFASSSGSWIETGRRGKTMLK